MLKYLKILRKFLCLIIYHFVQIFNIIINKFYICFIIQIFFSTLYFTKLLSVTRSGFSILRAFSSLCLPACITTFIFACIVNRWSFILIFLFEFTVSGNYMDRTKILYKANGKTSRNWQKLDRIGKLWCPILCNFWLLLPILIAAKWFGKNFKLADERSFYY